jgi:hypothetical protein
VSPPFTGVSDYKYLDRARLRPRNARHRRWAAKQEDI